MVKTLVNRGGFVESVAWTPEDDLVYSFLLGPNESIHRINKDGMKDTRLTAPRDMLLAGIGWIGCSPDGIYVQYTGTYGMDMELRRVKLAGRDGKRHLLPMNIVLSRLSFWMRRAYHWPLATLDRLEGRPVGRARRERLEKRNEEIQAMLDAQKKSENDE